MAMSPDNLCRFCPNPLKQFLLSVVNMKFDQEPNYSKLMSLFEGLLDPNPAIRPINTDGAQKVLCQKRSRTDEDNQNRKRTRVGVSGSQWISVFNARQPMNQRYHYNIPDEALAKHVTRGVGDGLLISSVSSCDNMWALIMGNGTGFTNQVYQSSTVFLDKEWIIENWEKNYYISSVAGSDNGGSLVVMSKGTRYAQQSYKVSDSFPFKWISKKWKDGLHVTSMATAGSKWGVVMSRGAGFTDQVVELDFMYPSEGVHKRWDTGYKITSAAATPDQVAFILSLSSRWPSDDIQETLRTLQFPCSLIKEKWQKNLYISGLCYGRTMS